MSSLIKLVRIPTSGKQYPSAFCNGCGSQLLADGLDQVHVLAHLLLLQEEHAQQARQTAFNTATDLCCCRVQAQREAWEEEERRRKFRASTRTLQNIYGTKVDYVCPCCMDKVAWLPFSTLQTDARHQRLQLPWMTWF